MNITLLSITSNLIILIKFSNLNYQYNKKQKLTILYLKYKINASNTIKSHKKITI